MSCAINFITWHLSYFLSRYSARREHHQQSGGVGGHSGERNFDDNTQTGGYSTGGGSDGGSSFQDDWTQLMPPIQRLEYQLFAGSNTGINFDRYEDIPVQISGNNPTGNIESVSVSFVNKAYFCSILSEKKLLVQRILRFC